MGLRLSVVAALSAATLGAPSWMVVPSPNAGPQAAGNTLLAVAALSPTDAWAVGARPNPSQFLTAALDAVGPDRREDEHPIGRARERGAVLLRHYDAPLRVQLLLKGREEHPRPRAPSAGRLGRA